jgi:DNA polymerase alpha subunit B
LVRVSQGGENGTTPTGAVYANRIGSGQIVQSYKPNLGVRGEFIPSSQRNQGKRCEINVSSDEFENVKQRFRFMYTSLDERARALDKHLLRLQKVLCHSVGIEESDLSPVGQVSQDDIWICGRICCETSEGRLNKASVVLEGSRRDSSGRRVHLDLSNSDISSYSLFPGQIVLLFGLNSGGRIFTVKKIVYGGSLPSLQTHIELFHKYHHSNLFQNGLPLSVMTACGPFTTNDNLSYAPLQDLFFKVLSSKPDVLVLVGPFVDVTQPLLSSGCVKLVDEDENGSIIAESNASYEMVFTMRVIRDCITALFAEDPSIPTNIILVPSLNDAHHEYVYPQPPFGDREEIKTEFFEESLGILNIPFSKDPEPNKNRIHLLPNPCMFR